MAQAADRAKLNRWMDRLVENMVGLESASTRFKAEHVRQANLLRRVAEYDPELARELIVGTVMFSYYSALSVTDKLSDFSHR